MEKEKIEQAAMDYVEQYCPDCHPLKKHDISLFIQGARWRIDSAWHDASEKPKFKGKVEKEMFMLFCNSKKYGLMLISQDEWDDFVERGMFHKWAYVDDLLPERKEVAR